jgi:hypothetical protein
MLRKTQFQFDLSEGHSFSCAVKLLKNNSALPKACVHPAKREERRKEKRGYSNIENALKEKSTLHQNAYDGRRHQIRHRSRQHGAKAEFRQLLPFVGGKRSDAADLNSD